MSVWCIFEIGLRTRSSYLLMFQKLMTSNEIRNKRIKEETNYLL